MRMLKAQSSPLFDGAGILGEHANEGHSMKSSSDYRVSGRKARGPQARCAVCPTCPKFVRPARASGTDRKVPPAVISLCVTSGRPRHRQGVFSYDFQTQEPPRFHRFSRTRWDTEAVRPRDEPSDRNGVCRTSHSTIGVGSRTSVASAPRRIFMRWFVDNCWFSLVTFMRKDRGLRLGCDLARAHISSLAWL